MAVRLAGVRLEAQNLAQYLNGTKQADDAYKRLTQTLQAFAQADQRATTAVRGAMQQRVAIAKAESTERIQAAKATSAQIIEQERRATATLRAELQQQAAARRQAAAAQRAASGGAGSFTDKLSAGVVGGIGRSALGFGLGLLGVQGAQQALGTTIELDRMAAQSRTTNIALTALAGGSGQAAEAIRQIQSAAPGSTNALEATGAAATIMTQKLNSSAVGVGEIAKAIAIIPQLSPSIKSTGDALAQLTLFASSSAFARADQLLVTADAVKQRIQELQAAYPGLTDAQAKAAATVQLVNEQFKEVGAALAENVPGIQKLTTAFEDLKLAIATGGIAPVDSFFGGLASGINSINVALGGGSLATRDATLGALRSDISKQFTDAQRNFSIEEGFGSRSGEKFLGGQVEEIDRLIASVKQANDLAASGAPAALEYQAAIQSIVTAVVNQRSVTEGQILDLQRLQILYPEIAAGAEAYAAAQQKIAEEQSTAAAATNLAELNEVRAQVDELAKSSLDLFDGGAPGAGELSSALIELQTHLAGSTQLSEEDAAAVQEAAKQHQLLAAAAGQSVGSLDAAAQAKLNDQVAALQDAQANQVLAASLQAVAAAQAGVARGVVSDLSGLIGSGLINAGQAGALNAQIQGQANAGFAGIQGQGLTGSALSFATAQLEREITEPFRQLQQIEVDMTREAQEQHRSAQGASKEWNKAQKDAEKAAKATAKALESVEGLFSPSKVTQGQLDIASAGGAVNLPDDFLRRFRDVSENFEKDGFREDFGGAELEQAREALRRIGVQPLEDLKGIFAQFEEAWSNLSLFSSKENLALINQQAVQDQLALQQKMEEGRKNIFELFGVAIDDATEAVGGGGGGIPPIDQEALQKKIEAAQQKFINQMLMGLGIGPGGTSDASLASVVTGAGGGDAARGGLGGLQQSFNNTASTSDILRGTFEGVTTTADILREAFGRSSEAADVWATKVNDIPPVIWQDHIDEFPAWKEDIIDAFPGWEHWLGPEKGTAPPPDGAIPSSDDVGVTHPGTSDIIRESMTQPASNTTSNTRTTTVTINTNQSTGSLIQDSAILQAQGAW